MILAQSAQRRSLEKEDGKAQQSNTKCQRNVASPFHQDETLVEDRREWHAGNEAGLLASF